MLQEVIDEYIASLSLKEQGRGGTNQNTVVAYRNDLNQVCSYLKRQQIGNWQQVTHEHIAGYVLEMRDAQAYRPATIARKLAALKRALAGSLPSIPRLTLAQPPTGGSV